MEITKKERDRLIKRISRASGVAQYALEAKMTDEQVIKAAEHLEVLELVKDANNFNRHKQGLKTQEANEKLKAFLDVQNSEILSAGLSAGKWLLNALSKTGSDRKTTLLEKDLVHKEDYNDAAKGLRDTIETLQEQIKEITANAETTISQLQKRIDTLRRQQIQIKEHIASKHGEREWQVIKNRFNID